MYTRRTFGRLALGALSFSAVGPMSAMPLSERKNAHLQGVAMGLESYSLAPLPHDGAFDVLLKFMVEMELGACSLFEPLIQPSELVAKVQAARAGVVRGVPPTAEQHTALAAADEAMKHWRMAVPLDYFKKVRARFDVAGVQLYTYSPSGMGAGSSEEELQRTCDICGALGLKRITTSMPRSTAKRFVPLAEKYGLQVGLQGQPNVNSTDPDKIATEADFREALSYSKNYGVQMDVGDATGAGFDTLKFVTENHARVHGLNLKDRKKDGTSMPWGEGETPIKGLLQYIRDNKLPIQCYIDCDYVTAPGGSRVADIKRCLVYAKAALSA